MRPISEITKKEVIMLLSEGLSEREVAKKVNISNFSVNKIRNETSLVIPKSKGGRISKLSTRDKLFCVRQVTKNKKKGAMEVQKALKNDLQIDVSTSTARRALKISGITTIVKPKKPLLSQKNVKERLHWAKVHKYWTIDDWKRVIWSDETKINRFGSDGMHFAWKREGDSLQPHHVKQTIKHGGGSIMVWGCITYDGPGFLTKIDSILDKDLYKTILNDELQHTISWYEYNQEKIIFQHDNDPKHTSALVKSYLEQQPYQVLNWPSQSPDLNPIENIWSMLKKRLFHCYDSPPSGMNDLWERVQEQWNNISVEDCRNVIESLPKRCQDIIKKKGYWIDY